MCKCCCDDERKVPDDETYKNLQNDTDRTRADISDEDDELVKIPNLLNIANHNYFYMENKIYDDEELLNMKIIDIKFGIHKTEITSGSYKGNISFHPFFYVNLHNPKTIGVII